MPKIKMLYSSRNFVIIQDTITKHIFLYSHDKPIAEFDPYSMSFELYDKSQRSLTHIGVFKKKLKDL